MSGQLNAALQSDQVGHCHVTVLLDSQVHSVLYVLFAETGLFDHEHVSDVINHQQHDIFFLSHFFYFLVEFGPLI